MKKLIAALFLFLASPVLAQEVVLTVPVSPPSEAKYAISPSKGFSLTQGRAEINMEVLSSGGGVLREYKIELPDGAHPAATINAMVTAMNTVIPGETGGVLRRMNARLHKFLADNSYFPPAAVNP